MAAVYTELLLKWNQSVIDMVPPEKLLVMDLKEGWGPLCEFLDLPVPDEPLPRANDGEAAEKRAREIFTKLTTIWCGIFSVSGGVVAFAVWKYLHRR